MKFSILIISYNRKNELSFTLRQIVKYLSDEVEILVYLDGCSDNSYFLINEFKQVVFFNVKKRVGASAAKRFLYAQAKGKYLIGLDDDSHPITTHFLTLIEAKFKASPETALLAFRLYWGVDDISFLAKNDEIYTGFQVSEFAACGFALRRDVYKKTGGFSTWLTIYGEELYLSLKIYDLGYTIEYYPEVLIQHRVDMILRSTSANKKFWFENQLQNMILINLVMFPFNISLWRLFKLLLHNFKKYATTSFSYFIIFIRVIFKSFLRVNLFICSKHRLQSSIYQVWASKPLPIFYWKLK